MGSGFMQDSAYYVQVKDYQGNVRAVLDQNHNVVERNDYYPYGGLINASDSQLQPYKYSSKEFDRENGLYWYDFSAKMFWTQKLAINLYGIMKQIVIIIIQILLIFICIWSFFCMIYMFLWHFFTMSSLESYLVIFLTEDMPWIISCLSLIFTIIYLFKRIVKFISKIYVSDKN